MLTKEKHVCPGLSAVAACLLLWLTGCGQSGPDALLEGKRMLDRGQPAMAVRKLKVATSSMPTNDLAWGYLGLAYHQNGAPQDAVAAYARALELNPALPQVRFNLGCLFLEQKRWAEASEQLTAATILDNRSASAWRLLGESQVWLKQPSQALQSLNNSLRLDPENADAWNWLGLALTQMERYAEAERSFQSALKLQANHGPALLNLAVLTQQGLNQPAKAADLYQQYLAFFPTAANASEIRGLIESLQTKPKPAPVEVASNPELSPQKPTSRTVVSTNNVTSEARSNAVQPSSVSSPRTVKEDPPSATVAQQSEVKPRIVKVEESAPVVSSSPGSVASAAPAVHETSAAPEIESSPLETNDVEDSTNQPKRGLFAKINPLNLFKKKQPKTTPLSPSASDSATEVTQPSTSRVHGEVSPIRPPQQIQVTGQFRRYDYNEIGTLNPGNRERAMEDFREADVLRKRQQTPAAIKLYNAAVADDPSFFEAQFNLGLLCYESGEFAQAIQAFQAATMLAPEAISARYNFALSLKAGGYPVDSANELLKVLAEDPNDSRAHLTLANLFATSLEDRTRARAHYKRVLELSPGHPEATAIHYWLLENPE